MHVLASLSHTPHAHTPHANTLVLSRTLPQHQAYRWICSWLNMYIAHTLYAHVHQCVYTSYAHLYCTTHVDTSTPVCVQLMWTPHVDTSTLLGTKCWKHTHTHTHTGTRTHTYTQTHTQPKTRTHTHAHTHKHTSGSAGEREGKRESARARAG